MVAHITRYLRPCPVERPQQNFSGMWVTAPGAEINLGVHRFLPLLSLDAT
jgi:hypothetical protein